MEELEEFIASNPDPRELKRAIAVQMRLQGYRYQEIQDLLQVSAGFIRDWFVGFEQQGIAGLRLGYQGARPYLDAGQRQAVIEWLRQKNYWHLPEWQQHLEETYKVVFQSKQSYYELFHAARISWKKSQASNPRKDPVLVEKKTGNQDTTGAVAS
jgi:putative transposase